MTARSIVAALGGRWCGSYGTCRCPSHDDRKPSLKVRDDLSKSDGLNVHCFSGCDWRNVKRVLRQRGLLHNGAYTSTRPHRAKSPPRPRQTPPPAHDPNYATDRSRAALTIWSESKPAPGTIVETYLRGRGITIPIPPTIRFHPALRHAGTELRLPAMVGAVTIAPGRAICGIHRTYVKATGDGKALVNNPKLSLGRCGGGAVRLAPAGETLMVSEGIETGLSVLQATDIPTWVALSTSGIRSLVLPALPLASTVIIAADGDDAGRTAAEAAAERWHREGRKVRIATPPEGTDFNDLITNSESAL